MNIAIDNRYSLSSDIHQFIILDGGRMVKFFSNLGNALDWLLRAKIRGSNVKSIEQLRYTVIKHSDRLQQLVTSIEFKDQVKKMEDGFQ